MAADRPLDAYSLIVSGVAEKLTPKVASLRVPRRGRGATGGESLGSGVVFTGDGFLLTKAHVVGQGGSGTGGVLGGTPGPPPGGRPPSPGRPGRPPARRAPPRPPPSSAKPTTWSSASWSWRSATRWAWPARSPRAWSVPSAGPCRLGGAAGPRPAGRARAGADRPGQRPPGGRGGAGRPSRPGRPSPRRPADLGRWSRRR